MKNSHKEQQYAAETIQSLVIFRWVADYREFLLVITLGSVIAITAVVPLVVGQTQQRPPFSLILHTVHATVEMGSPILVELTTTNNLSRTLKLGKTNPGMEYQIDVRDEYGKPVPRTNLYKELQNPSFVLRSTNQILKPQESAKDEFNIAEFFDFTRAGRYSVQVQRLVPLQYGSGAVKSNRTEVTVTSQKRTSCDLCGSPHGAGIREKRVNHSLTRLALLNE